MITLCDINNRRNKPINKLLKQNIANHKSDQLYFVFQLFNL